MLGLGLLSKALGLLVRGPARRLLTWATAGVTRSWWAGLLGGAASLNSTALGFSAIGLAESGIANFATALAVGLGAKAGATLALQLAATPLGALALPLVGVGFVLSLPKSSKTWGEIAMGLGLLLYGISLMVQALLPLTQSELFVLVRQALESSPLGLWVLGFGLAALLGSANAVAAIALALAASSALSLPAALALMLGGGGGSGLILLVGSWGAAPLARRIALAHILWKSLVSLVFLLALPVGTGFCLAVAQAFGMPPAAAVAQGHTLYHLMASVMALPFLGLMERLMQRLLPSAQRELSPKYLSQAALKSEALAVSLALREICRIGDQIKEMLAEAVRFLANGDGDSEEVARREEKVDLLARAIVLYLGDLSSRHAGEQPLMLMMAASEIEHLGDQVRRVLRQQAKLSVQHLEFSREGRDELAQAAQQIHGRLEQALAALATGNETLAYEVLHSREHMESTISQLRRSHLSRLERGRVESRATTLTHLDLLIVLDEMDQGITRLAALAQDLRRPLPAKFNSQAN